MNRLEDQIRVGKSTLRNRLVLPPLTTNYGTQTGRVTPEILRFYEVRSRHAGLVIVEAAAVNPEGRIVPGSIGLWEDGQVSGMGELASAIKSQGATVVVQLNHAGAKAWPFESSRPCLAPSDIGCRPGVTARPAEPGDLQKLVRDFVLAASRARQAGFDGVEIHGAHLYLLSQFLSPLTNHRTDSYGESQEGRAALAVEIVKAVRENLGPDYPVLFRLNVCENLEGGLTPEDAVANGKLLARAGVDVLDLSLAVQGTWKEEAETKVVVTSSAYGKDQVADGVVNVCGRFRDACGLPVIAVGRLNSRAAAQKALDAGADMVAVGRQMICDPGTIGKILEEREDEILACEACMACFAALGKGKPVSCKHNRNLPE